jgi:hypothetical protein
MTTNQRGLNMSKNDTMRRRMIRESLEATPRYQRAQRFSNQVVHMLWDFLPNDRDCLDRIQHYLMEVGFSANAEIISVPPECDNLDNLDKVALEQRRLEASMKPLQMVIERDKIWLER